MIITPNSKRKLPLESGQSYGSSKKRRSIKKNLVLELLPNALFGGSSTPVPGNTALYNQNGWRKKIRRLKRGCAECSPSFLLFRIHGPRCFRIPELLPECIVLNWEVQQAVCQLCKEKEQTTESPTFCRQVHASCGLSKAISWSYVELKMHPVPVLLKQMTTVMSKLITISNTPTFSCHTSLCCIGEEAFLLNVYIV